MKVHRKEEKFNSVVIELETQEEVDVLFAIASFHPVANALRSQEVTRLKDILTPVAGSGYEKWHNKLRDRICNKDM